MNRAALAAPLASALAALRLLALLAMSAASAQAQEAAIQVRHIAGIDHAAVREALIDAIAEEGLAAPSISHFGDMLDRTAADLGHPTGIYARAEILTFCSVRVAAVLAREAPHNIALCPLSIAVYSMEAAAGRVSLAYRPPGLDSPGGGMAADLLARIVARTAALLGVE